MEENLIIDDVISVYEGEFRRGYVKRSEARQCDGFCLYLEGEADYVFEDEVLTVKADEVLFLPEGGNYNITVKNPIKYICIDFLFTKKNLPPSVCRGAAGIKQDFYKFRYNWITSSSTRIPRAFELINRIYCRLINAETDARSSSGILFAKAVEIIVQHYREMDFTVESLAKRLSLSTVHLRRIFSRHIDKSPLKYINEMRFEQAKTLLSSSNLTVGEIALSLGFTDQFHFSKSFKSATGLSPSEYRTLNTGETQYFYY